ncbi:MAG: hypothetical protein R3A44_40780 [Caldilineaceae bacterium]
MTQVRYLLIGLCSWFFLLYNVERLAAPANIASFVYIMTVVAAVALFFVPRLSWVAFQWLFLAALVPFFALKWLLGYQIWGANWPITIVEISALALTIGLAQMLGRRFDKLQTLLVNLTTDPIDEEVHSFRTGQSQIYREIRRARQFQRPASLLAISTLDAPANPDQNPLLQDSYLRRFLEEIQRETLKKHITTRLANLLVSVLGDTAVVTKRDGHFVTLLPEASREQLDEIIQKLQKAAQDNLGLNLRIGISTFPDEAVTFESMLEHAELNMVNSAAEQTVKKTPFAGLHRKNEAPVEHRSNNAQAGAQPGNTPGASAPAAQPANPLPVSEYRNGDHRESRNLPLNPAA